MNARNIVLDSKIIHGSIYQPDSSTIFELQLPNCISPSYRSWATLAFRGLDFYSDNDDLYSTDSWVRLHRDTRFEMSVGLNAQQTTPNKVALRLKEIVFKVETEPGLVLIEYLREYQDIDTEGYSDSYRDELLTEATQALHLGEAESTDVTLLNITSTNTSFA